MDKSIKFDKYDYYVLEEITSSTDLRDIDDIMEECKYRTIVSFVSNLEHLDELHYKLVGLINYPPKRNTHHALKRDVMDALQYNVSEIEIPWNSNFITWKKETWRNIVLPCIEEGVKIRVLLETGDMTDEELKRTLLFLKSIGIRSIATSTGLSPKVTTVNDYSKIKDFFSGFEVKVIANIKSVKEAQQYLNLGVNFIATSINLIE